MYAEDKHSLLICLQGRHAGHGLGWHLQPLVLRRRARGARARTFWDAYTEAFEDALSRCSTSHAPWFIIPSNHKWFRNLAVSRVVVEALENLKMTFPQPSVNLDDIKKKYHALAEGKKGR